MTVILVLYNSTLKYSLSTYYYITNQLENFFQIRYRLITNYAQNEVFSMVP